MSIESLIDRIKSGEGLEIEYKAAAGGLPRSIWETISAFANTSGGWIFLGVTESNGELRIQGLKNPEELKQQIVNLMRNPQKISGEVCGAEDIKIEKLDDSSILLLRIRAVSTREKPVHINGNPYTGTYIRRNEGDYQCTKQEAIRMIRDASIESADSAILKEYSLEDLDRDTLARYRQIYRQSNPASPWNGYDDIRFLKSLQGYRRDQETEKEGLTRAAVLMFGKPETIANIRPRHLIDFRLLPDDADGRLERWLHRIPWEGNLFDAFFQIYPRLTEPLKTPFKLAGPHRLTETQAHEALREALVNMLVHADYSESAALLIKASPGEFAFRNPGSSRISEDDLLTGDRSDPRNPILLKMFRHASLAEEAGTGLPRILQIWRAARLQLPSLTSDTERYEFTLILRLVHLLSKEDRIWLAGCASYCSSPDQLPLPGIISLTENEQLTLLQARDRGFVNNASVQAATGLHRADVTALLTDLRERRLLIQISSRRWASYQLPEELKDHARKTSKKTYKEKTIKKTYKERSIKKTEALKERILRFCKIPRTAKEVASAVGRNHIYLITHYLTPLVKKGELVHTNPAQPKARNQKYIVAGGK